MTPNEAPEPIDLEDVTIQNLPEWVLQQLGHSKQPEEK